MTDLFYTGGPLFMGTLTILFVALVTVGVLSFVRSTNGKAGLISPVLVKEIGLLALVVGVLGQLIGLYSAFSIIEQAGTISPSLLANGLKVSSITTIYGLLICAAGYMGYFGLQFIHSKHQTAKK